MRENKITIRIKRPTSEVFSFVITPSNTHLWIDSIIKEEIEGDIIQVGTRYKNQGPTGKLGIYDVSQFKRNEIFELKNIVRTYAVRYTFKPVSQNESELEYFEWTIDEDLQYPLEAKNLEKLKSVLENRKQERGGGV